MLKFLHTCLKWAIASKELDALQRYRTHSDEAARFLAEFPAAADAIAYVQAMGEGRPTDDITRVRDAIDDRECARMHRLASAIRATPVPQAAPVPPRNLGQAFLDGSPGLVSALDDLGSHLSASWAGRHPVDPASWYEVAAR